MKFNSTVQMLATLAVVTSYGTVIAMPAQPGANAGNSTLGERSTDLEARQGPAAAAEVLEPLIDLAVKGIQSLIDGIQQDKDDRSQFTQALVGEMSKNNPDFNYVACHTKHDTKWDGKEGVDWSHSHREFDIQIGGTIGYEVYAAKSGVFTRIGDGGYLNWAYVGNVAKSEDDGKKITFATP